MEYPRKRIDEYFIEYRTKFSWQLLLQNTTNKPSKTEAFDSFGHALTDIRSRFWTCTTNVTDSVFLSIGILYEFLLSIFDLFERFLQVLIVHISIH